MKQFLKYLCIVLTVGLFFACEDPDKDPLVLENSAPFVKILVDNSSYDIGDLNSSFTGTLYSDAPELVDNHVISFAIDSGGQNTFFEILTVSGAELPLELNIPLSDLLEAAGLTIDDVDPGQRLIFRGRTTGVDGTVVDKTNTIDTSGSGINATGIRQAYEYFAFISCPFVESEIIGTYQVLVHAFDAFFGPQPPTREVIAGPGPNQYTILGGAIPLDGADDMIVTVNPATGAVSSGNPQGIHFNTFGPGQYGQVTGFTFSCVGFINLTITSPGFIPNTLTMQKL